MLSLPREDSLKQISALAFGSELKQNLIRKIFKGTLLKYDAISYKMFSTVPCLSLFGDSFLVENYQKLCSVLLSIYSIFLII